MFTSKREYHPTQQQSTCQTAQHAAPQVARRVVSLEPPPILQISHPAEPTPPGVDSISYYLAYEFGMLRRCITVKKLEPGQIEVAQMRYARVYLYYCQLLKWMSKEEAERRVCNIYMRVLSQEMRALEQKNK